MSATGPSRYTRLSALIAYLNDPVFNTTRPVMKGPAAEKAAHAAVEAMGGGQALEVEYQDGDSPGVYEVEVRRADGSHVEVHLNGQFESVGTGADDDAGKSGAGDD